MLCKEAEVFPELQIRQTYGRQQSQGPEEKPAQRPGHPVVTFRAGHLAAVRGTSHPHQGQQEEEEEFHNYVLRPSEPSMSTQPQTVFGWTSVDVSGSLRLGPPVLSPKAEEASGGGGTQ